MGLHFTPYIVFMLAAAAICFLIGCYAWRYRNVPVEQVVILIMMLAISEWLAASTLGYAATGPAGNILLAKIEYIGVVSVPLLVFIFSVNYSGNKHRLSPRNLILLGLVPAITLLLAWTNETHGLIWSVYSPYLENGLMFSEKTYGLWFWVYWVYSYLVLLAATVLIIRTALASSRVFMAQTLILIIGILVPWLGNAIYVLDISPFGNLDLTPVSFAFCGIILSLGIVRWHLFDIKPTAHIAVMENLSDGLILLDRRNRIMDINPAARRIFLVTIPEAIGKPALEILPVELFSDILNECEGKIRMEKTIPDNGIERHYEFNVSTFCDKGGDILGRIVVVHDSTELRLMHERLAASERSLLEQRVSESEDNYRRLFDSANDAIIIADIDSGIIVDVNREAESLLGRVRDEIIGMPRLDIHPSDKTNYYSQHFRKHIEAGSIIDFDAEVVKKDGAVVPVAISSSVVQLKGKSVIQGIFRDISERKKAQEESRRLREKAEMSSRLAAVGEMAAGIAHEINNPLTGVLGFSQLLAERQDLPSDVREGLNIIADGSNRVKDIVKRMLTFARQNKTVRNSASINELIENTLNLRTYVLRTANIEVIKNFDPDLPWLVVDPGQMQQVFLNLTVNAEYAMKKAHGKGILLITTEKKDGHIRISFTDDGTGMSQETKTKLFNPFFTTKQVNEGTGLGLSLSRSIILEHGGTIEVESEPGQGSNFIITLPITQPAEEASLETSSVTASSTTKARLGKFLVVDDEESIRKLASTILSNRGHIVDATGDAKEALTKLGNNSYDVVLMDIRMPGMSGMELYDLIIKAHPELSGKFIFITGDTSDAQTRDFLEQNKLSYITKPFDRETLLKKVNGLL